MLPLLRRVIASSVTTTPRGYPHRSARRDRRRVRDGFVANLDNAQLVGVDVLRGRAGEVGESMGPGFCVAMAHVMALARP